MKATPTTKLRARTPKALGQGTKLPNFKRLAPLFWSLVDGTSLELGCWSLELSHSTTPSLRFRAPQSSNGFLPPPHRARKRSASPPHAGTRRIVGAAGGWQRPTRRRSFLVWRLLQAGNHHPVHRAGTLA